MILFTVAKVMTNYMEIQEKIIYMAAQAMICLTEVQVMTSLRTKMEMILTCL